MMFRATVLAVVAAASAQEEEFNEKKITRDLNSCFRTYNTGLRNELIGVGNCDNILALEMCYSEKGLAALCAYDAKNTMCRQSMQIMEEARNSNIKCALEGDARFSLTGDIESDQNITRFTTQTYSAFSIKALLEELQETTMTQEVAEAQADELRNTLTTTSEELTDAIGDAARTMKRTATLNKIEVDAARDTIGDDIEKRIEELTSAIEDETTTLTEETTVKLNTLSEDIKGKLSTYEKKQTWPNATSDPRYYADYEFIMAETAPANTENDHAGRIMYKINFNPNLQGFWYPNRDELKRGCRALSVDLKAIDGIDRALKPAADVDWASDGDSVQLRGSYLSNCGCGGHPRQRQCVGMSNSFLTGAAMYNRQNSWHGCHMLRHDGRDCHHHWADCYSRRGVQADYTICTSSNANNKV